MKNTETQGHREHREYMDHRTLLTIPAFGIGELNLINNPTGAPVMRKCFRSCALCTGKIRSTAFTSTMSFSATMTSKRYARSSFNPLVNDGQVDLASEGNAAEREFPAEAVFVH